VIVDVVPARPVGATKGRRVSRELEEEAKHEDSVLSAGLRDRVVVKVSVARRLLLMSKVGVPVLSAEGVAEAKVLRLVAGEFLPDDGDAGKTGDLRSGGVDLSAPEVVAELELLLGRDVLIAKEDDCGGRRMRKEEKRKARKTRTGTLRDEESELVALLVVELRELNADKLSPEVGAQFDDLRGGGEESLLLLVSANTGVLVVDGSGTERGRELDVGGLLCVSKVIREKVSIGSKAKKRGEAKRRTGPVRVIVDVDAG
jgi:hypothetical protein